MCVYVVITHTAIMVMVYHRWTFDGLQSLANSYIVNWCYATKLYLSKLYINMTWIFLILSFLLISLCWFTKLMCKYHIIAILATFKNLIIRNGGSTFYVHLHGGWTFLMYALHFSLLHASFHHKLWCLNFDIILDCWEMWYFRHAISSLSCFSNIVWNTPLPFLFW